MKEINKERMIRLIESELTPDKKIRTTSLGKNHIYVFTFRDAPNLMTEVARLRTLTYRASGGGTGKTLDLDQYDVSQIPFRQLIVWNPEKKEIIGGYRFTRCKDHIDFDGTVYRSPFSEHFILSNTFIRSYLPFSIELGRAWIHPKYQALNGEKAALYALDNLWEGIGAVIQKNPQVCYLFGEITIYNQYPEKGRDLLLWFFDHYYRDNTNLAKPRYPVEYNPDCAGHSSFTMDDKKHDFSILVRSLKSLNCRIPPLVKAYLNLSDKIIITKATFNQHFGYVYEPGIILDVSGIQNNKRSRYIEARVESDCYV